MLTRPPSLGTVAAFEAAARHQSFAKAADELSLTRSAVSHAIRSLEQRLDARLFDRVGRQVVLTEEGARLATRVRASLAMLTHALDRRPLLTPSRLCLAAEPSVAARLLAPRLAAFTKVHPEVLVELRVGASTSAPASGDVDVMVCSGAAQPEGGAVRMMAVERLVPVAAPVHGGMRELSGVTGELLIESREHPWALWFTTSQALQRAGRPAIAVDSDVVAIELAKAGIGLCLAPSLLVQQELATGALVRLTRAHAPARCAYYVVWNPASPQVEQIAIFNAWLAETLGGAQPAEPALRVVGRTAWAAPSRPTPGGVTSCA